LHFKAALAFFVLTAFVPAIARAVDTIPFTEVNGGQIQVQASVDGGPPVPMIVDLGAGVDVLSTALGRRTVVVQGKYVSLRLNSSGSTFPWAPSSRLRSAA
jgi:hypothetical protein